MYANALYDFGNGPIAYKDAGNGPYTHYVDNTHPNATDTNNPFGDPTKPRARIPAVVPPGSVVEIHGGTASAPYSHNTCDGGKTCINGEGTASKPIFYRGISATARPIIQDRTILVRNSAYLIIENIACAQTGTNGAARLTMRTDLLRPHHISVRHCEFYGSGTDIGNGASISPEGDHIVVYDNKIHDIGDWQTLIENDFNAVSLQGVDVWIVDNEMYHMGSDCVGSGHAKNYTVHHNYIGRNIMHHTGENAVDMKEVTDFVVSQNKMYGYNLSGRDGTNIVAHYGPNESPKNIWIILNEIYEADTRAVQVGGGATNNPDEIYIVGNVIYGNTNPDSDAAGITSWGSDQIYVYNNTIFNSDVGMDLTGGATGSAIIENNIISNLNTTGTAVLYPTTYRASAVLKNNLYDAGTVEGTCQNCLTANPMYVNFAGNDVRLAAGSPGINSATTPSYVATFSNSFLAHYTALGSAEQANIAFDLTGRSRPQGGSWDIGAFEYTNCTSFPTVTFSALPDVCTGEPAFALSGGSPSGGTYTGVGVTGNNFDPTAAGLGTHSITYLFVDGNGCAASSIQSLTVGACTGIPSESQTNWFQLSPNPTHDIVSIRPEGNIEIHVRVTNSLGQTLLIDKGEGLQVDLTNKKPGVYFFQVSNGKSVGIRRVVKY
jgi:Secretion system C-terminal sorting domain